MASRCAFLCWVLSYNISQVVFPTKLVSFVVGQWGGLSVNFLVIIHYFVTVAVPTQIQTDSFTREYFVVMLGTVHIKKNIH